MLTNSITPPDRRSHLGAAPARGVLRPTRRGRLVVVCVLALVALAGFSLGRVSAQADGPSPPAYRHAVIQPGDTLWSIARRITPDRDPRETVAALERLNALPGGMLEAGRLLRLPSG